MLLRSTRGNLRTTTRLNLIALTFMVRRLIGDNLSNIRLLISLNRNHYRRRRYKIVKGHKSSLGSTTLCNLRTHIRGTKTVQVSMNAGLTQTIVRPRRSEEVSHITGLIHYLRRHKCTRQNNSKVRHYKRQNGNGTGLKRVIRQRLSNP